MNTNRQRQFYGRMYTRLLLLTTLMLLCIASVSAQSIVFARSDVGVGSAPFSVTTGNFNNDGNLDVAVANSGSNTISILLGNGDGMFQAAGSLGAGSEPEDVTTGDFNGDGNLDLAVANRLCGCVTIQLGNGSGSFLPSTSPSVPSNSRAVKSGDFNNDGKHDLIVANGFNDNVSLLLGNGDGTFQSAVNFTGLGTALFDVTTGDFNNDSKLDFAVAARDSGSISVRLGNGDGTFQPAISASVGGGSGSGPIGVTAGNFNKDSKLDLAVANGSNSAAQVLIGNGDGSFQPVISLSTGGGSLPNAVTTDDFDGDTNLDLAVSDSNNSKVVLLLNNGDGTFQAATSYSVGDAPRHLTHGDFNNDAKLDMVTANRLGNSVSFLINQSEENDVTPPSITIATPTNNATYLLNQTVAASYTCMDDGSGVATCAGPVAHSSNIDTASVGTKIFTVNAADNAGNSAQQSVSYKVVYAFSGFFQPIDNSVPNAAKAGQIIPVKWRLTDATGQPISDPASFVSVTSAATAGACGGTADAVEEYAGASGLQYLGDGTWQYNWKTPKNYAGQCRTMSLNLKDGTEHTALFTFK